MPIQTGSLSHVYAVLNDIAVLLPVFLLVFTWRGFFRAAIAKLMGDDTAQREGFLTLNPLAHVELVGLLVLMVVFFLMGVLFTGTLSRALLLIFWVIFGLRWTVPMPLDETRFWNYRLGGVMTALSGSLGNFTLAFLLVPILKVVLNVGLPTYAFLTLIEIIKNVIDIALFFGVLDLIPVPPFSGGRMLTYILPPSVQYITEWLERYSFIIFLVLFFFPVISDIFLGSVIISAGLIKKLMFSLFF
jgi:Zn-dependent protease